MESSLQRPAPPRRAAWNLIGLLLCLPAAAAAESEDLPELAAGQRDKTILALLDFNRVLCDGIAGKVIAHWQGLAGTPEAELEAVRQFVVNRELSDLAQSREAADIVESLLGDAGGGGGRETVAALERLQQLGVELCDTVAYPKESREHFEDELARILDRIEQEEAELGRLLVVPKAEREDALAPYLGRIQMAGVEAEGEYRDYLESLKPPPRLPTQQELMEAWHLRYSTAVQPTKQALAKYLAGRRANDVRMIGTACREISAAVIPLLRNDRVFVAPEEKLYQPLHRAFVEIKLLASECVAGHSREVEEHYGSMQTQLATASGLLAKFSLRP